MGIRRGLWRFFLAWRYRLLGRRRDDRLVLEQLDGMPLLVLPTVFNPTLFRTTPLFVRWLDAGVVPGGSSVLDLGTGTGALAIRAARWAHRVVAVDLNPEAVRCARLNVLLHRLEDRVTVRHGDLFVPVAGEVFDVVLFAPPYFRGAPASPKLLAFRALDIDRRFAAGLAEHLGTGGVAYVLLSSDGDEAGFLASFAAAGWEARPLRSFDLVSERVTIHRLGRGAAAG